MTTEIESLRSQLQALKHRHGAGELDEAQWHAARAPLERRLADLLVDGAALPAASTPSAAAPAAAPADVRAPAPRPSRTMVLGVSLFVLAIAVAGYAVTGDPRALDPAARAAVPAEGAGSVTREQIVDMVQRLAQRMKEQPDDAEGWTMLGRSYMVLEQPREAQAAFERARQLRPREASAVADLADAVAVNQGRKLAGEPARLVAEALALDPDHPKALALAGTAAFEVGDYATAVRHWERLAAVEPADSPLAAQARASAEEAKRLAGGSVGKLPAPPAAIDGNPAAPAPASTGASASRPSAPVSSASVSGTVTLAPALKGQARPEDTVFVFARAAQGPRMPLAILRAQVKDLPLRFTLDDRQAMAAGAGLSSATQVVVGARVSRSGQAAPQAGDLEGLSEPVAVGARNLRLEISRVLP
ncbi:MAG: hypothetical protein RI988_274 [Pseudomonadota bacterium]|jgi:cytochrome c-type biogenesis protein CcmH